MAENENICKLDMKDIPLGGNIDLVLDCANAVKTGEGKFGTWYLWFGSVENQTVKEGRYPDEKVIKDYTGKVLFFPTEKLNDKLEHLCSGNTGIKVKISKNAEEMNGKLIKKYSVEKLSDGVASSSDSSLTSNEQELMNDALELIKDGYEVSEDIFLKSAREPQYGDKITEERAKELYSKLNK